MRFGTKTYSESQILRGCINNERKFQEMLYRQHFDVMYAMVRRFTNDEERILDILNAGFLRVFKKIDTYTGEGSLQGWIRRIIYHSVSDHFRKHAGYLKFIVLDEVEKEHPQSVLDDLYYDELLEMVETLPERNRAVFRLYAIEGFSHQEIGEQLGIPEGTSKWHLSKAREQLRTLLNTRKQKRHVG